MLGTEASSRVHAPAPRPQLHEVTPQALLPVVPLLSDELGSPDWGRRMEAVKLLGRLFGQAGGAAVAAEWDDVLSELLRRFTDEKVRVWLCLLAWACLAWYAARCGSVGSAPGELCPAAGTAMLAGGLTTRPPNPPPARPRQVEVRLELVSLATRLIGSMPSEGARARVLAGVHSRLMDPDEKARRGARGREGCCERAHALRSRCCGARGKSAQGGMPSARQTPLLQRCAARRCAPRPARPSARCRSRTPASCPTRRPRAAARRASRT